MSAYLLPESVNEVLDDVETTLCLPILLVVVFCTLQYIVEHCLQIFCTIYTNLASSEKKVERAEKNQSSMTLCTCQPPADIRCSRCEGYEFRQFNGGCDRDTMYTKTREDDWEYCCYDNSCDEGDFADD
ncbi:uncharacterized protein LOC105704010 [Orussus abietinus]|uniref:uncharacterized protein LOC105704010 n=1 Tax=Orussus abietinus TaxID=222816 RepID=UPI0006261409|nr:uncharacterized protein LOC105704010 [Orussus abietinus]XP_012288263.1 uncharacterized protein LOC105704010 [Orussus abietinus]